MSDKRKVNVDGEDFEVSMEKEGDFWKVEVEGKIFSIKVDGSKGDHYLLGKRRELERLRGPE